MTSQPNGKHPAAFSGAPKPKTFQRLALHTAIATAVLSGAYARQSYAGSCAATGIETFSCSGPADPATDAQQSFGADGPVITTEAGFGIETTSDSAFFLRHFGGISFTDNVQSLITGQEDGIYALAFRDITVTTTGTVTGVTGDGIFAKADGGVGDLVITAVNVNGANRGVAAVQGGVGDLSVTTSGHVESGNDGINATVAAPGSNLVVNAGSISSSGGDGIFAKNSGSGSTAITANGDISAFDFGIYGANAGTDLTITAGSVSADGDAIRARNTGSGATVINSSGLLASTDGSGVDAFNTGTDLIIQVTDVSAADDAIQASNLGAGELVISSTGALFGEGDRGINAYQSSNGTSLTINAHDVYGRDEGIYANHNGSGALTITTTGTVATRNNYGIRVDASGAGDIHITTAAVTGGTQAGIYVEGGSGNITINAQGLVTGGNEGIYAENRGDDAGDITINATDVVARVSGITAIQSGAGNVVVTATGSVSATYAEGITVLNTDVGGDITINAADVNGGYTAVYGSQRGVGDLTITTTGDLVAADGEGIRANSLSATAGDINITAHNVSGSNEGISVEAEGSGTVSVTTTGDVIGQNSHGVEVYQSANGTDVTVHSHNVSGAPHGIYINNLGAGATTVTATGLVTGTGGNAIEIHNDSNGGDISVDVVDTYGSDLGIVVEQNGTGTTTVNSRGTVTALADDGIVASNTTAGGDIIITAANINAYSDGIYAEQNGNGNLIITTTGHIISQNADGIAADNSSGSIGDIIINAVDVTGGSDGIEVDIDSNGGNLFITSTGTVVGLGSNGIEASSNDSGGDITVNAHNATGQYDGIEVNQDGRGDTFITATGQVTGLEADGIFMDNDEEGGNITVTAVDVSGGDSGINADQEGVGSLTITTTGSVVGETQDGINAYVIDSGTDLTINAVDVSGEQHGIYARHDGSGTLAITTQGTVTANSGHALLLERNAPGSVAGSIHNSGSLTSNSNTAVVLTAGSNFSGEFINSGDISGGNGIALDASGTTAGMQFTHQTGTITGDILLGSGEDRVTIHGGALNGTIVGQGHGEVVIDLGSGNSFDALEITNVKDYTIRSGRVNQLGDFSTAGTTTTIESGATMAFTSTINGSGALVSDGNLLFVIDGVNAGKLVQAGTVTLNDGSSVSLDTGNLALDFNSSFDLIDATTLIDNGAQVTDTSLLFDFDLAADGSLSTRLANLGAISNNSNTSAFGAAVTEQFSIDRNINDPLAALLATLSADDVAAFERLAGSLAPSVSGAISNSARSANTLASQLLLERLTEASADRDDFWVRGFAMASEHDGTNDVEGYSADTSGLMLGYDHQWGPWLAGVALASASSEADNDRFAADRIDTDSTQLLVYGGYRLGNWQLQGSASYSSLELDMQRQSPLPGESRISASTDGTLMSVSAGISYDLGVFSGVTLRPLAQLQYSSLSVDDFREDGGLNLAVSYDAIDTLSSELGMAAEFGSVELGSQWTATPHLRASWSHDFLAEEERATARFAQQTFEQNGFEAERDLLNMAAGVTLEHRSGLSLRLEYQGKVGDDFTHHQGTVGLHYAF